ALTMLGFVFLIASLRRLARGRRAVACLANMLCGASLGVAAATKLSALPVAVVVVAVCLTNALRTWRGRSLSSAACDLAVSLAPALATMAVVFVGINPYFWASPKLPEPQGQGQIVVAGLPRTPEWLHETQRLASLGVVGRFRHLLNY